MKRQGSELVLGPIGARVLVLGLVRRARAIAATGVDAIAAERRLPVAEKLEGALATNRPEA